MKIYQVAALALLLSASTASACERQKIGGDAVEFGMMRGQPNLDGAPLWKLANGITVLWCGRTSTDSRGIVWNWVSAQWQEEPWPHEGWVSSRIVERDVPTITRDVPTTTPNENWEPSQTWQKSSKDNPYAYGLGIMKCGDALDVFKGESGNNAIISFIGGYMTALNGMSETGDLANSEKVQTLAGRVGSACKAHRDWPFQKAIVAVVKQLSDSSL
jgi:hypothetical protein